MRFQFYCIRITRITTIANPTTCIRFTSEPGKWNRIFFRNDFRIWIEFISVCFFFSFFEICFFNPIAEEQRRHLNTNIVRWEDRKWRTKGKKKRRRKKKKKEKKIEIYHWWDYSRKRANESNRLNEQQTTDWIAVKGTTTNGKKMDKGTWVRGKRSIQPKEVVDTEGALSDINPRM